MLIRKNPNIVTLAGAFGLMSLQMGCGPVPDDGSALDPELETQQHAFGSNIGDMMNPVGHSWASAKAYDLLANRNMLPEELKGTSTFDAKYHIIYGSHFADEPWMGRPEKREQPVWNHMTQSLGTDQATVRCPTGALSCTSTVAILDRKSDSETVSGSPDVKLEAAASLWWKTTRERPTVSLMSELWVKGAPSNFIIRWFEDPDPTRQEPSADNNFHFPLGDLDPDQTLVLHPPPSGTPSHVTNFVDKMSIVAGGQFGALTYGANLYQLSRRFFENSLGHPAPDSSLLEKAGPTRPGWSTGRLQGRPGLERVSVPFPHTYLGGNPFICAGSNSGDPCRDGRPTWPVWVPKTYNAADRAGFLAALENPRPERNTAAALVYLGWAAHMAQDMALPHHASGFTGHQHSVQDYFGELIPRMPDKSILRCPDGRLQPSMAFMTSLAREWYEGRMKVQDFDLSAFAGSKVVVKWTLDPNSLRPVGRRFTGIEYQTCQGAVTASLDSLIQRNVNTILGSPESPWSFDQICSNVSLPETLPADRLAWDSVTGFFRAIADKSRSQFNEQIGGKASLTQGVDYMRRAFEATVKLFVCAPPRKLSPAVHAALTVTHD